MARRRFVITVAIIAVAAAAVAAPALAQHGGVGRGGGRSYAPPSATQLPRAYRAPAPSRPIFGPKAPGGGTAAQPPRRFHVGPGVGHGYPRSHGPAVDLRGRTLHQMTPAQSAMWRHGHWHHGRHHRHHRFGWWWIVGGYWYWYEEPTYPYPAYVSPEAEEEEPGAAAAPEEEEEGTGEGGDVYYYCGDPAGYYPDVATCFVPWQVVPANQSP